ncbi:MAG: aminodeoxychorismate synthase component I [Alphaproteobacteria bacterium]|nr:aminodeoxychorismate synthase component I [Alphaproteobacteria bacterium]MDE2110886.1 aminodeoxychorismate synthase component I [Alphaproteobacteria bacterium]
MTHLILDDAATGRAKVFAPALGVIRADASDEVAAALEAIEAATAAGQYVAGYFSYELGYVLEARLRPLMPSNRAVPLLWFGRFEMPQVAEDTGAALAARSAGRAYAGPLTHEWDAAAYRRRFDRVRGLIAAGDFYQANLTFRSRFGFVGDPLTLYCALREYSAARYGAYIDDGERQILSLSPELFFELATHGGVTVRPMKGTAARGADSVSDAEARARLAASAKDRAENLMIVDLLRNDLGRIAEVGSVGVSGLFDVETYPTLHQMVSTVTARLKHGAGAGEIVRALFPCGSITGAPKIRAMEAIAELEQSPRGVYCGAIGYFAPDGSARFNVAIRTLTISGNRGELGLGGAVVQDSRCDAEYAECLLKARYYEIARRPLELIETLRFSPGEGFVRRDLHLARMLRSAGMLGIPFDVGRAHRALEEALPLPLRGRQKNPQAEQVKFSVKGNDLRVRLTLTDDGRFACTAAALPPGPSSWAYLISAQRISSADALIRHKISWRDMYEREHANLPPGCHEIVFLNERGEVAEGSRTNIFILRDGKLRTPPLSSGTLDGVLRRSLIEEGRCEEATLMPEDLTDADVYLGNSLRGLIRAVPASRA